MNKPEAPDKVYYPALAFWVIAYLFLGYISLSLDNRQSSVALVWFPAGAAVSAFLSMPRKAWPLLFASLFIARLLLDLLISHSFETSLPLPLISLGENLCIAWAVQHFGGNRDNLKKVNIWLIATFIFSALAAVLAAGWIVTQHKLPLFRTMWMWWAANVSGTIVATTVLTGFTWEPSRMGSRQCLSAVIGVILVGLSTALIFNMPPDEAENAGLVYGLACIPVLLTVLVPLVGGNQAGALSFLTLCAVVIFFSWQQTGPFFISGLFKREPLLLAQCYLSGTAVLMIFIRLQIRLRDSRHRIHQEKSSEIAFRLDTATGHIDWDPYVTPPLGDIVAHIESRDKLFELVPATVKKQMQSRWQAVASGLPVHDSLVFRITLPDKSWHTVSEQNIFYIPEENGGFIIGYWSLVPGSLPLNRTQEY